MSNKRISTPAARIIRNEYARRTPTNKTTLKSLQKKYNVSYRTIASIVRGKRKKDEVDLSRDIRAHESQVLIKKNYKVYMALKYKSHRKINYLPFKDTYKPLNPRIKHRIDHATASLIFNAYTKLRTPLATLIDQHEFISPTLIALIIDCYNPTAKAFTNPSNKRGTTLYQTWETDPWRWEYQHVPQ